MKSIYHDCKVNVALAYATGTADRKGPTTGIDTAGFKSAAFIVSFSAIASGGANSVKLQHSDDTTDGNFADILGSSITMADDDDDELRILEVGEVKKRYIRLYVDKDASNACAESAICVLYNADESPVTQPTGTEGEFDAVATSGTA